MFITNTHQDRRLRADPLQRVPAHRQHAGYWLVLLAYAVVGLGAAAYSPAKYGILTELLPPEQLVVANGWIEGLTVASIVLGTLLGGVLIAPDDLERAAARSTCRSSTRSIDTPPEAAIVVIGVIYVIAALFNLAHPGHRRALRRTRSATRVRLLRRLLALLRACSGATSWGRSRSRSPRSSGARARRCSSSSSSGPRSALEAAARPGRDAAGHLRRSASPSARCSPRAIVPLERVGRSVLPLGIAMGVVVIAHDLRDSGCRLRLRAAGARSARSAGFFVVPMNALLQHRGHVLHVRRALDRGAELQREREHPRDARALLADDRMRPARSTSIIVIFGGRSSPARCMIIRWNSANHRADPTLDQPRSGEAKH